MEIKLRMWAIFRIITGMDMVN